MCLCIRILESLSELEEDHITMPEVRLVGAIQGEEQEIQVVPAGLVSGTNTCVRGKRPGDRHNSGDYSAKENEP